MIDDLPLRAIARVQHGLVSVEQSTECGFDTNGRARLVDGRRWERVTPRVLGMVGAPASKGYRALLAVLDAGPGAALGASSAAAWWGIPGNRLEPFELVTLRGHVNRPPRSGRLHEPKLLLAHHSVVLECVPTVVPARALFEIAGSTRRGAELPWWVERIARMVDTAWAMRLVSGASLHRMLDELAQRGRPGIRVMRQVLETRPIDYIPPASGLESRFAQILARAGHPPMRRQVDVGDELGWIGRVDFRAHDLPLIAEVQSERFHTSQIDRQLDRDRISRLRRAGFTVLEIVEEDVWHRPSAVAAQVAQGRLLARAAA